MARPPAAWEPLYRQEVLPPWSLGRPQPEMAALIARGEMRSDVLDAGCGHAALSLDLAERGYTVVGLDSSPTAIAAATMKATANRLHSASFAEADITSLSGYDGRFRTVLDSGLMHSIPIESRLAYVQSIYRAAAPGARLFILAFADTAVNKSAARLIHGLSEPELCEIVSVAWKVDSVRPAKLYSAPVNRKFNADAFLDVEKHEDGLLTVAGFLLSARKIDDKPPHARNEQFGCLSADGDRRARSERYG